jgi:hypothetical protein
MSAVSIIVLPPSLKKANGCVATAVESRGDLTDVCVRETGNEASRQVGVCRSLMLRMRLGWQKEREVMSKGIDNRRMVSLSPLKR